MTFEEYQAKYDKLVEEAERWISNKKKSFEEMGVAPDDNYFTYKINMEREDCPIQYFTIGLELFKNQSINELKETIEDKQEEIEELKSELEDLDAGFEVSQFDDKKEYENKCYELRDEIYSLEIEIELCRKFISEEFESQLSEYTPLQMLKHVNHLTCDKLKHTIEVERNGFLRYGGKVEDFYPVCQFDSDGSPVFLVINNMGYFKGLSAEGLQNCLVESKKELEEHFEDAPCKDNYDSKEEYYDIFIDWSLERFAIELKIGICESLIAENF